MDMYTGCYDEEEQVCCDYKRALLRNCSLFYDITIQPRVVHFKKYAKCKTYKETVEITNKSKMTRKFTITSDCEKDVAYKINGDLEISPEMSITIDIYLEPTTKCHSNRRYHIFVSSVHPNMTLEIPIIIISQNTDILAPKFINLPTTSPKIWSYYGLVLWNPMPNALDVQIFESCRNTLSKSNLRFEPEVAIVPALSYALLCIKGRSDNFSALVAELSLRLSNRTSVVVQVKCEMVTYMPFMHKHSVCFKEIPLGSECIKCLPICNESEDVFHFKWRPKVKMTEMDLGEDERETDIFNPSNEGDGDQDNFGLMADFLKIYPREGKIAPNSSIDVNVNFCPSMDVTIADEEISEPPYLLKTTAQLVGLNTDSCIDIEICGRTSGPEFEFSQKEILLNDIYLGERQCEEILVINKGPMPGLMNFKHLDSYQDSYFQVNLPTVYLEPEQYERLTIEFFGRDVGEFLDKAVFKVKYGKFVKLLIRGNCQPVKILTWPDELNLGPIPICISQKQFIMLANPLSVPIVVHSKVVDDGIDDPLVLDVNITRLPVSLSRRLRVSESSISTTDDILRDPMGFQYWLYKSNIPLPSRHLRPMMGSVVSEFIPVIPDDDDGRVSATESSTSTQYEQEVEAKMSTLATDLIQSLKISKAYQWSEADLKIVDEILDQLISTPYFEKFRNVHEYMQMDWEELNCNPREVVIDTHPFYLKPYESKIFPILLIPNQIGLISKWIYFQCCPVGTRSQEISDVVSSDFMTKKFEVHYHCKFPKIEVLDETIVLGDVYVDLEKDVQITFRNQSHYSGYVYFKIIPKTMDGEMFVNGYDKFHICAEETIVVSVTVIFLETGLRVLPAMVNIVGSQRPVLIKIAATVNPPELIITPLKMNEAVQVLDKLNHRFWIENISPTLARFVVILKNIKHSSCEPRGGILGPGQKVLITMTSYFYDPEVYKNCLTVKIVNADDIKIPITFRVEGIPIVFTPNIKNGFIMGPVFVSDHIYETKITAKNHGEHLYRINLSKRPYCTALNPDSLPKGFQIEPNSLTLQPKEEKSIVISVKSTKNIYIHNEYTVNGFYYNNRRFFFFRFGASVHFIKSQIKWDKEEVILKIDNYEKAQDKCCEFVKLTNTTPLPIFVQLKVIGHFVILEHLPKKHFEFELAGCGSKQIMIMFKDSLFSRSSSSTCVKGKVNCKIANKPQKSLQLIAFLSYPMMKFANSNNIYFTPNIPFSAYFGIVNCGPIDGNFKLECIDETEFCHSVVGLTDHMSDQINIYESILNDFNATPLSKLLKRRQSPICDDISTDSESDVEVELEEISEETVKSRRSKTSVKSVPSSILSSIPSKRSSERVDINIGDGPTEVKDEDDYPKVTFEDIVKELDTFLNKTRPKVLAESDLILPHMQSSMQQKCSCFTKNIYFHYTDDTLEGNGSRWIPWYLPAPERGICVRSTFELSVVGGNSETGTVTVYNFPGKVELSTNEFNFGKQPWYKIFTRKLKIFNRADLEFKIDLLLNQYRNDEQNLTEGFIEVKSSDSFQMAPKSEHIVEIKTYMGLSGNFHDGFGVNVNNSNPMAVNVLGQGLLPFLTILNLPRNLASRDHSLEFEALNFLYKAQVEDADQLVEEIITQDEVDQLALHLAKFKKKSSNATRKSKTSLEKVIARESVILKPADVVGSVKAIKRITNGHILSLTDNGMFIRNPHKKLSFQAQTIQAYDNRIRDFQVLDYPEEYTDILTIERTIETLHFVRYLSIFKELARAFKALCMKYVKFESEKLQKYQMPVNYKSFIVRPIPYQTCPYILDFGNILMESVHTFSIEFLFQGPGKGILSVRTLLAIPGFYAEFVRPSIETPFLVVNTPFDTLQYKKYLNIRERENIPRNPDCRNCRLSDDPCEFCDIKLCHAHSYDIDLRMVHQRQLDKKARKTINAYYSKLNQGYKDQKDPNVLSEVFQQDGKNLPSEGVFMKLEIKFAPGVGCYRSGQTFDDFLFIDIHLGPTIPIQMYGKFISKSEQFTTNKIVST